MKVKGINSITHRWVLNTLCVIIALMAIIGSVVSAFLYSYYYDSVSNVLDAQNEAVVNSYFAAYAGADTERFETGAMSFVESFDSKDIMEVWVINSKGDVVVTSNGFGSVEGEMPDYFQALESSGKTAKWTGRLTTGEKVMTRTVVVSDGSSTEPIAAVRYIISLKSIDRQLLTIVFFVVLICAFVIAMVAVSGVFFIRSIVRPVKNINETAKKIALGDFSVHIDGHTYDDEIGELCDTINYMAGEISQTDKIKNDFISTVSHELRTPLTAINGWGETILQAEKSDEELIQKGIRIIVRESKRLTEMVEELLDFSRMQSGRMTLQIEKMDVLAELDETIFVFRERAQREGIELVYNSTDDLAPMNGDPNRIKQVFVNILDNAIKYNSQGGRIVVIAEVSTENVRIIVGDSGCGISPEDLPKVKEKFYKANVSVRGSGIGLAVADEIVRLHGGELIIDSVVGVGTTVTVTLPIIPVEIPTMVLPDERSEDDEQQGS